MYYYQLSAPDFECLNDRWLTHTEEFTEAQFKQHIVTATELVVGDRVAKGEYIHRFGTLELDDVVDVLCETFGYEPMEPTQSVHVLGHGSLFTEEEDDDWPEDEMLSRIRAELQRRGYTWEHDSMLNYNGKHLKGT